MVQQLAEEMRQMAQSHEFAQCHFLDIAQHDMPENALRQWVADGMYGDMDWMESRLEHRAHPQNLWPDVRSIIMLGMSYAPAENPMALADLPEFGRFSVYAQGVDYHKIVKKRLKAMARDIFTMVEALPKEERQKLLPHGRSLEVKVFVDTAPVMEKPLAQMAGLGWQGKHSNVVSRSHGNWLFLGSIFTNMHLPADEPEVDHCGRCSACMAACPTGAIVAPYTVDARKCISYLTIEHKGVIAHRYRAQMGNHIYGCDDCLAACPWNKFADAAQANRAYLPRAELTTPYLGDILSLSDDEFREVFAGTPIKRSGRARIVRNAAIAAGNSGDKGFCPILQKLVFDEEVMVQSAAIWALKRLDEAAFQSCYSQWQDAQEAQNEHQPNPIILAEWQGTCPVELGLVRP